MESEFPNLPPLSNRDNDTWLDELSGHHGIAAQRRAHLDLSDILYKALYYYLRRRMESLNVLSTFSDDEIAMLAQDFVQDALVKLAQDDFKLLDKFQGRGTFPNWMSQVAVNIASSELRRPYWVRRERSGRRGDSRGGNSANSGMSYSNGIDQDEQELGAGDGQVENDASLQDIVEQREREQAILDCRATLNERYRTVFDQIIVDEKQPEEVAQTLGTTTNAIYILVSRVKAKMRRCLEKRGFGL